VVIKTPLVVEASVVAVIEDSPSVVEVAEVSVVVASVVAKA